MRLPRRILNYGLTALLLEWEQSIDPAINLSVHTYAKAISAHQAVTESVPAYCSLLVSFDHQQTNAYRLREWIYDLRLAIDTTTKSKLHRLPVVYGGDFGPDLAATAKKLRLSQKKLIELHSSAVYHVYQLGFQPGFAFLGLTDEKIAVDRLATPRTLVPAGSVGLAGRQTAVYPVASPGGWQIIGRCPASLWDATKTIPARLKAGDRVKFYPVNANEWDTLVKKTAKWKA